MVGTKYTAEELDAYAIKCVICKTVISPANHNIAIRNWSYVPFCKSCYSKVLNGSIRKRE